MSLSGLFAVTEPELAGISDGDIHWRVGLGEIGRQADDLLLAIVWIDAKGSRLVEIAKMLEDDVDAPEASPVALGRRGCLGYEQR